MGRKYYLDPDSGEKIYIRDKVPKRFQSDWNQTDTTKADFIKNKPTIPAAYDDSQIRSDLLQKANQSEVDDYWNIAKGTVWDSVVDSEAGDKTVVSNARHCEVKSIGGKSVCWNQMNDNTSSSKTDKGVTYTNNNDGTWILNGTSENTTWFANVDYVKNRNKLVNGHKYLLSCNKTVDNGWYVSIVNPNTNKVNTPNGGGSVIFTYSYIDGDDSGVFCRIFTIGNHTFDNVTIRPLYFDLTKLFGVGNEPTTTTDPRIAQIKEYASLHPEYNEGEIIHSLPKEVVISDSDDEVTKTITLSDTLKSLPWYSAGSVYNELVIYDDGNSRKGKFIRRVDNVRLVDGEITGDVLSTPIITDVTSSLGDLAKMFEVESGGSISIVQNQDYDMDVPFSVEYVVKKSISSYDDTEVRNLIAGKQNTLTDSDKQSITKTGMTSGSDWTSTEQANARKRIGAVKDGDFELIAEVTTTEELETFTMVSDASGNPIKLKTAVLEILCPATSSNGSLQTGFLFKYKGDLGSSTVTAGPTMSALGTSKRFTILESSYVDGFLQKGYAYSSDRGNTVGGSCYLRMANSLNRTSIDYITGIKIMRYSTSLLIPAGTNFRLYGVRA